MGTAGGPPPRWPPPFPTSAAASHLLLSTPAAPDSRRARDQTLVASHPEPSEARLSYRAGNARSPAPEPSAEAWLPHRLPFRRHSCRRPPHWAPSSALSYYRHVNIDMSTIWALRVMSGFQCEVYHCGIVYCFIVLP